MLLIAWFLAGAIAASGMGFVCMKHNDEITFNEAGGMLLMFLAGFLGLALAFIFASIIFFEEHGDSAIFKRREAKPARDPWRAPAKCEHEQPCYRPECNK